ncbi:hypothetical protein TKK_0017524 [Trichogramma kaykai]
MDMPEDCWSDHVGLLQEVPNASSADHQQQPQSSSSDYLMLSHSHHHEVGASSSLSVCPESKPFSYETRFKLYYMSPKSSSHSLKKKR